MKWNFTLTQARVWQVIRRDSLTPYASIGILMAASVLGPSSVSAQISDTQPPSIPGALTVTAATSTSISLSWTASIDNVGVTAYLVERCEGAGCTNFSQVTSTTSTAYNNTGRTVLTSYSYRVRARDAANKRSGYSNVATSVTPDTTVPARPTSLAPTAISSSQINLTWTTATDNVGVTGYRIERCTGTSCSNFIQIAAASISSYGNTELTAATTYRYRVRSEDAAGNLSTYSPIGSARTLVPDIQAPTTPTALTINAISGTQINLNWMPASDNVAVTNYLIERCQGAGCLVFTQVAASTSTFYNDFGRAAGASYSYRLRATDAANNFSGYTPIQTATTPGTVDCD